MCSDRYNGVAKADLSISLIFHVNSADSGRSFISNNGISMFMLHGSVKWIIHCNNKKKMCGFPLPSFTPFIPDRLTPKTHSGLYLFLFQIHLSLLTSFKLLSKIFVHFIIIMMFKGDKMSMLTYTYIHKPTRKIKWPSAVTRLTFTYNILLDARHLNWWLANIEISMTIRHWTSLLRWGFMKQH